MKKIIAIILCVLLAFSAVSLTAFAQEEQPTATQEETTDVTTQEDAEEDGNNESTDVTPEEPKSPFVRVEDGEYLPNLLEALKQAGMATVTFPVMILVGLAFVPGMIAVPLILLLSYANVFIALLGYKSLMDWF